MVEFDVAEFIRNLEVNGPPTDPRPGLDTAALVGADPSLARVRVEDVAIDGPHGAVVARIYTGSTADPVDGLVWVHGGGFVGGSLDMPEAHWVSLYIASRGVPVMSVDYRKALHGVKYPVPVDDVLAAWKWAAGPDRPLGVDAERLHLGGASAGANLSTAVAQRLRDEGAAGPRSLVLVYPLLHAELPALSDELRAALDENPPPVRFTPGVVRGFNTNYAGEPLGKARYAFPADGDLAGLPPILIVNAEADEMRASGEDFGAKLAALRHPHSSRTALGTQHGYLDLPGDPSARRTLDDLIEWIADAESPHDAGGALT
ncbi:alpha/beta hydrolase [Microbacterium sp. SSM24]|uniref:alpha/beta hydrolase n=1 Tax=Microbacterium sp. SSM24 TaxID=2991714 RepID=UPI002225CD18|nr:alpha/beta hydrolase [Microbacterium sp. SSM24]MCW3492686.1 alpha/beta hydrolase [Microbacterium sp. SSM24]